MRMTMRMTMQRHDYPNIGETLYSAELPNGLRLRVVPKKGFATFYAAFAANYGGADRRFELDGEAIDTPAGVAHFLEHKMFDLPDGDSAMNLLSANGAEPNAFTSSDMTCYYFQCTKSFEENLRLLLHFVSTPYFTPETVQKEQGIIAQEILMGEDNPGMAIYYQLLRQLYARHPIRDRVAGTVESISGITDKTLYDCHRAFYAPSNMALCVEGDVDPERIYAIALEALPQEKMPVPHADYGEAENLLPAECFASREMPVSAPQFLIGAKIAPAQRGSENLRQRLVAQLALRLLAGGSSPFYSRLYAEGLLCRDFDYEVDFAAGTGTVIFGGESQQPERVLEELKAEAARISAEGFEPERFERAKRASFGARLRGFEDFDNVCVSLAGAAFDGYDAFAAPAVLSEVTADECAAFIRENLAPERLAISIITPARN